MTYFSGSWQGNQAAHLLPVLKGNERGLFGRVSLTIVSFCGLTQPIDSWNHWYFYLSYLWFKFHTRSRIFNPSISDHGLSINLFIWMSHTQRKFLLDCTQHSHCFHNWHSSISDEPNSTFCLIWFVMLLENYILIISIIYITVCLLPKSKFQQSDYSNLSCLDQQWNKFLTLQTEDFWMGKKHWNILMGRN